MSDNIITVITLKNPWATWVIRGWKTIETRTHRRFKNLVSQQVYIHCSLIEDADDSAVYNPYLTKEQLSEITNKTTNGCIIGSVNVYNFKKLSEQHSKASLIDCKNTIRYGSFLKEPVALETPIFVKGELGIWYYDIDKKEKVKKPVLNILNNSIQNKFDC